VDQPPLIVRLDYGTVRSRRGRRLTICAIAVCLIGAAFIIGTRIENTVLPRWRNAQAQKLVIAQWNTWLAHVDPPDQIVYDEDPASARVLLQDRVNYFQWMQAPLLTAARRWPTERASIDKALPDFHFPDPTDPVLFFGERSNPSLNERMLLIVCLHFTRAGFYDGQDHWSFDIIELLPNWEGGMGMREWRPVLGVPDELNNMDKFKYRFYSGQADPADQTHFTIHYAVNGQGGTLDGRLDRMSQVVLTIRDGPATRPAAP
jgi:hypothetical protein